MKEITRFNIKEKNGLAEIYLVSVEVLPNLPKFCQNPEEIIEKACGYFGIKRDTLCSKSRKKHLVNARYFLMKTLFKNTDMSFAAVGALFNRDHATVIYGIKSLGELIELYPDVREKYDDFLYYITQQTNQFVNNFTR